ncbi:MAG: hypothetical protein OEY01_10785 [Desulfobulbaceae bacterium]|nr:hypothetical protein [Desulfobulbaceae bacterium]
MRTPTVEQVIKAMRIKGYAVFDSPGGFDLNIVGIRAKEARSEKFDDLMVVFHRRAGHWCYNVFPCTTDPGRYWLENPMVESGTGILKEGQHRGVYQVGKHQGKYEALVQTGGELPVIRDFNRDGVLDFDGGREETGYFGCNIHHAGELSEPTQVGKWSALCQVLANWWDFQIFMALCKAGKQAYGNRFTYTLLNEKDFGATP